jgi:pilus assembly protein Flp/PilA
MSRVFAFLKDESGASAIEYGLIAAGISIVIIASVNAIGSSLNTNFDIISTPAQVSSSAAGFLEAASA